MRTALLWLTIASLACSGGCASLAFLPAATTQTLLNPTHVEAYRVGLLAEHPGYGGKMDGFAVISTGQASTDLGNTLGRTFADPTNYTDPLEGGDFIPDIGYRFYRRVDSAHGQMAVDVLISFDSDRILMVARDPKLRENFRRLLGADRSRAELLDLARQAFAEDSFVQSLPLIRPAATRQSGD